MIRTRVLKIFPTCLLMIAAFSYVVKAQSTFSKSVHQYIKTLAKTDGGYGWADQPDGHLTPAFAVTGILHDLGLLPKDRSSLITYLQTHHPQRGANKEAGHSGTEERDLVYQQMQALAWLGADLAPFTNEVTGWKPQNNKTSNFEQHGYPVFLQEMMTPVCMSLLKLDISATARLLGSYIHSRLRGNGSFNNTPASDGGDGNVLNTYWGYFALRSLSLPMADSGAAVQWLRACQGKGGGFKHQPAPEIGVNEEIAYTWAGIKALALLNATPVDRNACIRFVLSLRNEDGGFGNRPGVPSSPMATYYAVDVLKTLDAFNAADKYKPQQKATAKPADFTGLKVYTVQFEASGSGSPEEAVMLADSLGIHLWGSKNAKPGWRERAQQIADERKVPVTFFQSDEAYGKSVTVEGLGTFSHIMDYIAPASANKKLDLDGSSWQQYHKTFIAPLLKDNGALILQVTNNEPLGRIILDESLSHGGFSAISTVHFGQNFSFWLPWLHEYRHLLPFVTLQDAHGTESWWWATELAAHRTLFLAREPGYDDMMKALTSNLMVAVRHDSLSDYKTRLLGGAPGVHAFVQAQEASWKWWTDDSVVTRRPMAAITVVQPTDSFEVDRPEKGVNIRVRCQWKSTRQLLEAPIVRLDDLIMNETPVAFQYIEIKDSRGMVSDAYYIAKLPGLNKGEYRLDASFTEIASGKKASSSKRFTVR